MKNDLFDLYFEYCADTEPPAVFHRWSIIGCIGAFLGRQLWLPHNGSNLFPNQYIMFVGDPGTRKSSAIKRAAKLIRIAGFEQFGAQKTSMEKFLLDLQDGNLDSDAITGENNGPKTKKEALDVLANLNLKGDGNVQDEEPREMFVAADEFNNFIGNGNLSFQSLLGELWDWDEPESFYKQRLKNSKSVRIYQPTINILAGNTPSSFAECFPLASIGQGFMSRLILVHGENTGLKITFPKEPSSKLKEQLITHLQRMKITCQGAVTMHSGAKDALEMIYKGWPDLEDQRFLHYSTRRFTHLLKLTMVVCAARLSTNFTVEDVLYANTMLSFIEATMPKAIGELGKSRNSEAANKIMQTLYSARETKSITDLWKVVSNDLDKIGDLAALLINLQQSDKIQAVKANGKEGFLAKQKHMSRTAPYTNFEILKGREVEYSQRIQSVS